MATDNQVVLVGNLTDDPELRLTPQGAAVANLQRTSRGGRDGA